MMVPLPAGTYVPCPRIHWGSLVMCSPGVTIVELFEVGSSSSDMSTSLSSAGASRRGGRGALGGRIETPIVDGVCESVGFLVDIQNYNRLLHVVENCWMSSCVAGGCGREVVVISTP